MADYISGCLVNSFRQGVQEINTGDDVAYIFND